MILWDILALTNAMKYYRKLFMASNALEPKKLIYSLLHRLYTK